MKINLKISHRYAVSLLESAIEKKIIEKIFKDMQLVANVLQSSRELRVALENPIINPEVKEKIVVELFGGKVEKESLEFVKFIIAKRREEFLLSIALRFLELYDDHIGVASVNVKTAFEISDEQKYMLKDKIEKILKIDVRLNFQIDRDIISGFVARVGDTLYDASLQHQLDLLKRQFLKGNFSLN
jgi:F-type H+-transporting ATPase subunit delta